MEFHYRAGDERRSRSPPPPTSTASAATSASGSADGHGVGDGAVERAEMNPAAVPTDADELRRQAEKAKIRERILREEAEHWVLEAEVRRELMEQLLRLAAPVLGRQAGGSDAPVAPPPPSPLPRMVAANSSSPVAPEVAQAQSKTNILATPSAKRKSPDQNVASTVSAATSSKKYKPSLSCTVCGIMLTGEKAMGDHLNGKGHRKKAAALAQPPPEQEIAEEAAERDAMTMTPTVDYTPTKLTMLTNAGTMEEVTQMDGFLLCEVCNVRTADRVTMMCHLEGTKHITSAQKKRLAKNNGAKGQPMPAPTTSAPGDDRPDTVVLEVDGVPHAVRRVDGSLLCELCGVNAPAESGMRCHLSGKKHKNKAKAQARTTATSAKEGCATVESSKAPGKNEVKVGAATAVAEADGAGDSDSLTMEVDGVKHPLRRVDGFLVCVCCDVKAPAEVVMRSHLVGKKHKNKMAVSAAAVNAGAGGKGAAVVVATGGQMQGNGSMTAKADGEKEIELLVAPQAENSSGMAPMDVDEPAKAESIVTPTESSKDREISAEAKKDEHSAGEINGSVTQVKESVKTTDGVIAETTGTPVKIQVEGKLFVVLRQENGRLSCERCGVHGCDKDGMLQHLYTKTHWEKARLAEEAAACASATAAEVDKKGEACGGEHVPEETAQVKK
ncbi:hypothetical protein ACP70R_018162 [Stipagrostis hirtigluma subsp. patula]